MELDPSNREAATALAHTRSLLGRSSSTSSGSGGGSFSAFPSVSVFLDRAKQLCAQGLAHSLLLWGRLTASQRQLAGGAVVVALGYLLFFAGRSGYGGYGGGYDSYDSGYGDGYGGYGGLGGMLGRGGGLSWTVWGGLMAAGYYLPPMFADVLGPEVRTVASCLKC